RAGAVSPQACGIPGPDDVTARSAPSGSRRRYRTPSRGRRQFGACCGAGSLSQRPSAPSPAPRKESRPAHRRQSGSAPQARPRETTHANDEKLLALQWLVDSARCMIRAGFLSREDRADLIALALDGSAADRLGLRANALVLLDDGLSCEEVAKVLFLDDDTVRRSRPALAQSSPVSGKSTSTSRRIAWGSNLLGFNLGGLSLKGLGDAF